MLVVASCNVKYNGVLHPTGSEFEIAMTDEARLSALVERVERDIPIVDSSVDSEPQHEIAEQNTYVGRGRPRKAN